MLHEKNLEITRQSGTLTITYRWRTRMAYVLLGFALFWNAFLGVFLLAGAGFFISAHALVGLGMAYYGLALLLNKSKIAVDRQYLRVEHGPLPTFSRKREIRSGEISQLYLKRGGTVRSGNTVTQLYALRLRTRQGSEVKLLSGIPDLGLGKRIEQEIEGYLDIEDREPEDTFVLPDLGILEKFIPPHVRAEMERAGRDMQGPSIPTPSGNIPLPQSLRQAAPPAPVEHADHLAYDFALCHADVGARFSVRDAPYRLVERSVLRWTGTHEGTESLDLRVNPEAAGPPRQFYAVEDGNQWAYFEERTLDTEEAASLGFEGEEPPVSLRNGDDRYHLLSHHRGELHGTYGQVPVEQYIYYSSRSVSRFRALRLAGGRWVVMIQEPADASYIEALG